MRKLRNTGSDIDVDDRLLELDGGLADVSDLVAAFLHGSYGTPDQTPLSDVDLAFVFQPGKVPSGDKELRFRNRTLEHLAEDDVSITVLNRASPIFQFRVIGSGRLLFCRDEAGLADFKAEVFSRHADFMIDYSTFLEEYDEALVEEYGVG